MLKSNLKFFLIALLIIQLTGCATCQKNNSSTVTEKDKWFAKDKLQHFTATFLIGAATYSVARWGNAGKDEAGIAGFSFSSAIGIAKEINDEKKRNAWSYKDLVWDFIGGGAGVSFANTLD